MNKEMAHEWVLEKSVVFHAGFSLGSSPEQFVKKVGQLVSRGECEKHPGLNDSAVSSDGYPGIRVSEKQYLRVERWMKQEASEKFPALVPGFPKTTSHVDASAVL